MKGLQLMYVDPASCHLDRASLWIDFDHQSQIKRFLNLRLLPGLKLFPILIKIIHDCRLQR